MPVPTSINEGKLTKKFLMELDEGLYLVSNVYWDYNKPVFEDYVYPLANRNEQWKKIVTVGANQRHCEVFENKEKYTECNFNRFLNHLMKK